MKDLFLITFIEKLRLSKPWRYKFPLLLSFTYIFFFTDSLDSRQALIYFLSAVLTTIGFAGIGYLTNDLSDLEADKRAGKNNGLANLSRFQIYLIGISFILLALIPWWILPIDEVSVGLIVSELLLFVLYAFPPIRLKEKGLLGLIADAGYAHVIPGILAIWTFNLATNEVFAELTSLIVIVGSWQLISGIRNILSHQISDYDNDLLSNTKTVVTSIGKASANRWMTHFLIPFEFVGAAVFVGFLSQFIWYSWIIAIVHLLINAVRLGRSMNNTSIKNFTTYMLDEFYVKWLPILVLSGSFFVEMEIRYILLIHLVLFTRWKELLEFFRRFFQSNLLFGFISYYRGLLIHLSILLIYTSLFIGAYFYLDSVIKDIDYFMHLQSLLSIGLIATIMLHAALLVTMRWHQTVSSIWEFLFAPSSAFNLGVFRFIFFFIAAASILHDGFGRFENWTHLPSSQRSGLPMAEWVNYIPVTPQLYFWACVLGVIFACLTMLGVGTKYASKFYAVLAFYIWGIPMFYGKLNHHHIMFWLPLIFAFSRCGDAFSIDYLWKKLKGKSVDLVHHWKYGFPLKGLWVLLALIYSVSGFHKLYDTGLYWALSDNLANQIQLEWIENYDVISNFRVDQFPILLKIGGILVILFEILYPVFLIKGATRIVNFSGAWILHLSAGYFLNIDFVILRVVHLSMLNFERIKNRIVKSEHQEIAIERNIDYKKHGVIWVAAILFSGNLTMSIIGVSSYPFSMYPSYSSIVEDETEVIEIIAFDKNLKSIDVKQIGLQNQFKWENIRPFELEIAQLYHENKSSKLEEKLKEYWQLWRVNNPQLASVDALEMYLIKIPLNPDLRDSIKERHFLGKLSPNEKGSHYINQSK